ncbi:MAG: hypothetical protein MR471_00250 [Clostridia bacterium]|nr:hypothetical protein [Clostridia bacterium]MDY3784892.1 hypothetical protein [Eubacteriales bacterium]
MAIRKNKQTKEMSSFNENMLSSLFDYQRFENDHVLQALIDETEKSYGGEISDDELSQVSAAGEVIPTEKRKKQGDGTV